MEGFRNSICIQSNDLITACYHLPLAAKRLLLLGISKMDNLAMPIAEPVAITVAEWQEHFGHKSSGWKRLKEAADKLYDSEVILCDRDDETKRQRWVENCTYHDGKAWVSFQLTQVVATYVTNQVIGNFTRIDLAAIRELQSAYSIRLYELLARYRGTGWYHVSVEDLREMLALGNKYQKFAELRRRVIDHSTDELNGIDAMHVRWKPVTQGRKVIALKFKFRMPEEQQMLPGMN